MTWTVKPKLLFTMAFMPNARHSALHVGHVWILSHIQKHLAAVRSDIDLFDVRLVLYLDGVFPRYADCMMDDLAYLGVTFEEFHCLRDWTALAIEYAKIQEPPFQAFAKIGHGDVMCKLARMFFFKERGVRVHVRGDDLLEFSGYERQLAEILGWPYPKMIFVPLLTDASEKKIGRIADIPVEYLVETYRKQHVPAERFRALLSAAIAASSIKFAACPPDMTPFRRNILLPVDWYEKRKGD